MNEKYIKEMAEYYNRHSNFEELCDYHNLDNEKIIMKFKEVFFEGIRRDGSWENQVLQSMFCMETLEEDYQRVSYE